MLVLQVLQGPDKGRRFELPDHEPQQIGRSSEALPLTDATISRRHAELTPDEGRWVLRDLESSNGTFVNGVRLSAPRTLRPGDQVRCGATLILFGEHARPRPGKRAIRVAQRGEMDISVEHTVAANDESLIMASPAEPGDAATFQLDVIYDLISLIGSVTDQNELLEKVMDVIFDHFKADRGFILLQERDDEGAEPQVVRHRDNVPAPKVTPDAITVSRTIVTYVVRRGVGILSANAMSDSRFSAGDSVQAYGIRSAMCVPIRHKGKTYGVIYLDSQVANYTYTEDQLTLLTAIGVQTGLALANNRLLAERLKSERLAAVGQTVASLSHSIKNILQGMRGGADVVELGMRKNNMKVLRNGWEIVQRNQERIYQLAMNMLAFSKQRKPELQMTALAGLLSEIAELMQKPFDDKQAMLLTDFASDLPPVPIDASGVHQAVLNLVTNALDAVEPEAGVVSLRCEYDAEKCVARLRVADNGVGMSVEQTRRLFVPFHSTKGLKGTGLGLVVTKKIVDEHGGLLDVQSTPGGGTTFLIELPTEAAAVPHSADTHGPMGSDDSDLPLLTDAAAESF
ncbi:MAG: ATP-binding protein [Planctomycetota bacterium]